MTSPPYWSLRNYGIEGQIGLEDSVESFIKALTRTFDEVRRVLRKDGTLWLNIGDSYTSGGRTWRAPDKKNRARAMDIRPPTPDGLKPKDLIGVPWRLAFALQAAGWYLRADVIWNKPNAQPESVADRPTRSHEYVFLLSKSERYYYDVSAVRGPNGRRVRTVWDVKTQAMPEAKGHFATFPPALIEPCILSASRPGDLVLDPFAGSGTTALVAGRQGRRFVGVELRPEYVAMAQQRLQRAGFPALDESDNGLPPTPVDPNQDELDLMARATSAGVPHAETVARTGDPVSEICAVADDRDVDVIVVGSHDRTALGRLINPSVAAGVVRETYRPVLVVSGKPPTGRV